MRYAMTFAFVLVSVIALAGSVQADQAVEIDPGSGSFSVAGGARHRTDTIAVHYHRPDSFNGDSPVLLVISGSGRNADEYRDAWIRASESRGILVLAPGYPAGQYRFGDYHMGGLVEETNATDIADYIDHSHQVRFDESRAFFRINADKDQYLFNDFDRIFRVAVDALDGTQDGYDIYGHSAGGQILHRMALLQPETRARRIVAANSGFYTLPVFDIDVPFGLKTAPVRAEDLRRSFRRKLVVLLGENDDNPGSGGIFLRSPSADRQGFGRLQRGRHFFHTGRIMASDMQAEFNWRLQTVADVGHDHAGMSRAAARLLYGTD